MPARIEFGLNYIQIVWHIFGLCYLFPIKIYTGVSYQNRFNEMVPQRTFWLEIQKNRFWSNTYYLKADYF